MLSQNFALFLTTYNALVSVKCLFVHFFQTTATLITVRTEMDVLKQLFFKASLRPSAKISSLLDKQSEVQIDWWPIWCSVVYNAMKNVLLPS